MRTGVLHHQIPVLRTKGPCNYHNGRVVPVKFAEVLGNNSVRCADQKSQWAQSCKNCSFEVMSNKRFEKTIGLNRLAFIKFLPIVRHVYILIRTHNGTLIMEH